MNFKRYVEASDTWVDSHYIMGTSTDTITTLPADIYANDTTATVGLKGNMEQNGTPTPTNPIQPQECGDRTAQLWDISSWDGATAQRGTLERVTNGYKLTATSNDAYTMTYGSGAYSYSVIGDSECTLSWTVDNPQIYGVIYIFTGTSVADTPLTTAVASSGSKTFTVPSGHNYVAFRLGVSNAGDEITYTNIMLNTGSTPLPYEPYGYKIPISSASTTTPIYLGEVETTRKIYKYTFTGQENWTYSASGNKKRVFVTGFDRAQIATSLCSHFVNTDYVSYPDSGKYAINTASTTQSMIFGVTDMAITSATDWTTYLAQQYSAGTPVTVWYVLAEPTTGIVNEPLRKIGDYADEVSGISIPTIAGANTISVDTTLQPSEVTVNYKGWHPVQSVHEKSKNLFDGNYVNAYVTTSGIYNYPDSTTKSIIVKCDPNTTYTIKQIDNIGTSHKWRIAVFNSMPTNSAQGTILVNDDSLSESTITTVNDSAYIVVYYTYTASPYNAEFMINLGSTTLPYEPYWK